MKHGGHIVKGIMVTEKSTQLAEKQNKYFFRVSPVANKIEIKEAVEKGFGVKVTSVNTARYEGKRKRERTAKYGKRNDWKRAIVTLKDGSKIDLT